MKFVLFFVLLTAVIAYSKSSSAEYVKELVESHEVVIFSKTYCPFCRRAKMFFEKFSNVLDVHIIELNTRDDGREIQSVFRKEYHHNTVPAVFLDGKFIGGADEIMSYSKTSAFQDFLNEHGVREEL